MEIDQVSQKDEQNHNRPFLGFGSSSHTAVEAVSNWDEDPYVSYYRKCAMKILPFVAVIFVLYMMVAGFHHTNSSRGVDDSAAATVATNDQNTENILGTQPPVVPLDTNENEDKSGGGEDDNSNDDGLSEYQSPDHTFAPLESLEDDESHLKDVALLELLPWERASIEGLEEDNPASTSNCKPPPGVSAACCLGTFVQRVKFISNKREECAHVGMEMYDQMFDDVQVYVEQDPPSTSNVKCDICEIADLSARNNLTVSFMGDSGSLQVWHGLECELSRRNYQITSSSIKWIQSCGREGGCSIPHHRFQVNTRYGEADFRFFFQYNATSGDAYEREEVIAAISDVVVLNFGLEWNHEDRVFHSDDVSKLLKIFSEKGKHSHQLIAYREASAQHFATQGGDKSYLKDDLVKSAAPCAPLDEKEIEISKWRDNAVRSGAKKASYEWVEPDPITRIYPPPTSITTGELVFLPYFDFTAPYWNMHPHTTPRLDCHHYCSSPYLYVPMWRDLRNGMDRQFGADRRLMEDNDHERQRYLKNSGGKKGKRTQPFF